MLKFTDYDIVFQEFPGETTLAITISNCPNGCAGCHSPFLQKDLGEPLSESLLLSLLQKYGLAITCVGLMGGDSDPFEVLRLARFLKEQSVAKVKVGWYSGKTQLLAGFDFSLFDYLKLGPYNERYGPLKSPTTNQRMYRVEGDGLINITQCFWDYAINRM